MTDSTDVSDVKMTRFDGQSSDSGMPGSSIGRVCLWNGLLA